MRHKYKTLIAFLIGITLSQPFLVLAQQDILPEFNPNLIIPDTTFADTQTFGGPEGIQKFLESKNSPLANTSPDFLTLLSEPNDPTFKQTLGDPNYQADHIRTAAELIWDASQASGLNPQVIVTTLQKEQGLITGGNNTTPDKIKRALDFAMGFACPDNAGCGQLFQGFYYQLFGNIDTEGNRYIGSAKSLMKSFSTPNGRGPTIAGSETQVGDSVTLDNSTGGYTNVTPQQTITLGDKATAALYRYTPHVFNGNYNFWHYFTSWFKYANGTLIKLLGDSSLYIIQDGQRDQVLDFVAQARKLDASSIITVSPTQLQDYPLGSLYGPADKTIIAVNGKTYVFYDNIKHPASAFVLNQRKLDVTKAITVAEADADQFTAGTQLTPDDGTVLRGVTNSAAYLVQGGILRAFSDFTFKQMKAAKKLQAIPDAEIASYPKSGYVIPLDGTLVRGSHSNLAYLIDQGQKHALTQALFKNLGYSQSKVVALSDEEIGSYPVGATPTPKERTFFRTANSKDLYLFEDGARHYIPAFVAKQRYITPDYVFDDLLVAEWPNGIAIPPLDSTLVKADTDPTIYLVLNGQLRPITTDIFKNRGLSMKNVKTLPAADIDLLPKGDFAPPKDNSYFITKKSKDIYVYKNGVKRSISDFVASQRGMTPDYTFDDATVAVWPNGPAVPPRDGTFLQSSDTGAYYYVSGGKVRKIADAVAAGRLKTQLKAAHTVMQAEINGYTLGTAILK